MPDIGIQVFEKWFQEQSLSGVNIILMGFLLWALYKKAYIPAVMGLIAISFVSIFIIAPEKSRDVAAFLGRMFGIG